MTNLPITNSEINRFFLLDDLLTMISDRADDSVVTTLVAIAKLLGRILAKTPSELKNTNEIVLIAAEWAVGDGLPHAEQILESLREALQIEAEEPFLGEENGYSSS